MTTFIKHIIKHLCPSDLPFDISICQSRLRTIYKTSSYWSEFYPGFLQPISAEFYADPDLEVVEKPGHNRFQSKSISYIDMIDLLTATDNEGKSLGHILLSGVVGTGKSRLLSRTAYKWAMLNKHREEGVAEANKNFISRLKPFKLVLLLDASAITKEMDLVDAIVDQLLPNVSRSVLENYLLVNSSACLYLFDEFDRFQGDEDRILNSTIVSESCVIVTSRPKAVREFTRTNHGYVWISLKGITKRSVDTYVRNHLSILNEGKSSTEDSGSVLHSIKHTKYLSDISHFPFVLCIVCQYWKDCQKYPETVFFLYRSVIECLTKHYKTKDNSLISLSPKELTLKVQDILEHLGKFVSDRIMQGDLFVNIQGETELEHQLFTDACTLGFVTCNRQGTFFINKGFEEFCIAVYLAKLARENENEFKSRIRRKKIMTANTRNCVLGHLVQNSLQSKTKDVTLDDMYKITRENDAWRLPLIFLHETESQGDMKDMSLQTLLKQLDFPFIWPCVYHDSDYEVFLQSLANRNQSQINWFALVSKSIMDLERIKSKKELEVTTQLLQQMSNLSTLDIRDCARQTSSFDDDGGWLRRKGELTTYKSTTSELTSDDHESVELLDTYSTSEKLDVIQSSNPSKLQSVSNVLSRAMGGIRIMFQSFWKSEHPPTESQKDVKSTGQEYDKVQEHDEVFDDYQKNYWQTRTGVYSEGKSKKARDEKFQLSPLRHRQTESTQYESFEDTKTGQESSEHPKDQHRGKWNYQRKSSERPGENKLTRINLDSGIDSRPLSERTILINFDQRARVKGRDGELQPVSTAIGDCFEAMSKNNFKQTTRALRKLAIYDLTPLKPSVEALNSFLKLQTGLEILEFHNFKNTFIYDSIYWPRCIQSIHLCSSQYRDDFHLDFKGVENLNTTGLISMKITYPYKMVHVDALSKLRIPQLQRLQLSKCIDKNAAQKLAVSLKCMPDLRELTLVGNTEVFLGDDGAIAITFSFRFTPHLTRLNLPGNRIGDDGAVALSESLSHIQQLEYLDLAYNVIGSNGAIALSKSFCHLTQFRHFDIKYNSIGNEGFEAMGKSSHFLSLLSHLNLKVTICGAKYRTGFIAFLKSLQHTPRLTHLDLSTNQMTDVEADVLSHTLQYLPTLVHLDLGWNYIGDAGLISISKALHQIPDIQHLDLSHNKIENAGVIALAKSLHHIPQLTHLDLLGNTATSDAGITALAESFHDIPNLTYLDLYTDGSYGPTGVEAVFRNLVHLPQLGYLHVAWESRTPTSEYSDLLKACVTVLDPDKSEKYGYFDKWLRTEDIQKVVREVKKHVSY